MAEDTRSRPIYSWRYFILGALIVSAISAVAARQAADYDQARVRSELSSRDWKARRSGFYHLRGFSDVGQAVPTGSEALKLRPDLASRSEVRGDLINLLSIENLKANHPVQNSPDLEEYFNYYGDLIGTVASLRDPRAIPALADAIGTGNLATTGLANFGDLSLPTVLVKLGSPDAIVRAAALSTAKKMLELNTLSGAQQKSRLKDIFLRSLRDPDASVRVSAVYALGALDDVTVIPVIADVARNDPFALRGQAEDGKDLYPVRHAATLVLQRGHSLKQ